MRGGEKVIQELCKLYPDADIFTHVVDPDKVAPLISGRTVQTTFIARMPFSRRFYQYYLILMPFALEVLDLSGYDLVISSEAGPAKGVITGPRTLHVCYCHSPMRYVWDQFNQYVNSKGVLARWAFYIFGPCLRMWDVTTAARVDCFVANSSFVAGRIRKFYRRGAHVLNPPVDVDAFRVSRSNEGFYLVVGQMVAYKRVDLAVRAFTELGKRLIVIGTGEQEKALAKLAGPTIEFRGWQSDEEVARAYGECRALIFPGEEDFGIVPVEAMACGKPVIAFGRGGALDTVIDGRTGMLFGEQTVESLKACVTAFEARESSFDPDAIRAHAETFDRRHFNERFSRIVEQARAELIAGSGGAA
ncbi:glycosyltransferase [Nostoc sp. NIES-2111]